MLGVAENPEEAMEIVKWLESEGRMPTIDQLLGAVQEVRKELGLKKGRQARPASFEALRFEAQVADSWRMLRSKEISTIQKLSSTDKKRKVHQVVELVLQGRALEIDVTLDALLQLAGKDHKTCDEYATVIPERWLDFDLEAYREILKLTYGRIPGLLKGSVLKDSRSF